MMPAWMSAGTALMLFLAASLWMVAAKKRRWISLTWQQIYLVIWALAGCLGGLGLFSALEERVDTSIFILAVFCLTGSGVLTGYFLAEGRHLDYDSWGRHFLPFLEPRSHKTFRKLHRR